MRVNTGSRWDVFCRIVDNFGDIGICWRLSQQLAREHHLKVRLFIDDFGVASKIILGLDHAQALQTINGVEVCGWPADDIDTIKPADVVVENFSCGLPSSYIKQIHIQSTLKNTSSDTIWINLDYLSAESWVSDFHARPSPHSSLKLTKHFFFPGFTTETGGLIREENLIATREAFLNSNALQENFLHKLGVIELETTPLATPIKISLFFYPEAQINALFLALAAHSQPVTVILPFNSNITTLSVMLTDFKKTIGKVYKNGNLTVHLLPFLSQSDYDHLLWTCDLNFVRGEDSWIRAIWAGKPFVWQPYIQTEDIHITKLKAFLEVYTEDAGSHVAEDVRAMLFKSNLLWSGKTETDDIELKNNASQIQHWHQLIKCLPSLKSYAIQRANSFNSQDDLATKLVIFSENLTKNKV